MFEILITCSGGFAATLLAMRAMGNILNTPDILPGELPISEVSENGSSGLDDPALADPVERYEREDDWSTTAKWISEATGQRPVS